MRRWWRDVRRWVLTRRLALWTTPEGLAAAWRAAPDAMAGLARIQVMAAGARSGMTAETSVVTVCGPTIFDLIEEGEAIAEEQGELERIE
jgi:hypothetical protein